MKKSYLVILAISINFFFSEISSSLPVELVSFTSSVMTNNVTLEWQTVFENNNSGFYVERKSADSSNWSQLGFVMGANMPHTYNYSDNGLALGNYNYRLKQVDFNNAFQYYNLNSVVVIMTISVSNNTSVVADNIKLYQNYPNPFNPSTVISYQLSINSFVTLEIFDAPGNKVKTLVNQKQNAGEYSVTFNAEGLSSGMYFYKLQSNEFIETKKMMIVR